MSATGAVVQTSRRAFSHLHKLASMEKLKPITIPCVFVSRVAVFFSLLCHAPRFAKCGSCSGAAYKDPMTNSQLREKKLLGA